MEDEAKIAELGKYILELKTALETAPKSRRRSDDDLDSIEVGSASKGGVAKIYFNHRKDDIKDVMLKLQDMLEAANKAKYLAEGAKQDGVQ